MSQTLHFVCVECRENSYVGGVYGTEGSPNVWHIDHLENLRSANDYFLLAHRGHVIGLVDGGTIERASPDSDVIEDTFHIDDIARRHPDQGLDDADYIAPAGELLASLLKIPPGW